MTNRGESRTRSRVRRDRLEDGFPGRACIRENGIARNASLRGVIHVKKREVCGSRGTVATRREEGRSVSKHNGRNNEGRGEGRDRRDTRRGGEGRARGSRGAVRSFFATRRGNRERHCRLAMRRFHVRVAALIARKRKICRRASVIAGIAQYAADTCCSASVRNGANPITRYMEGKGSGEEKLYRQRNCVAICER